jgi:hypothetical protein
MDSTVKIRALNDALLAIAAGNDRIYVTAGIAALQMQDQIEIMSACAGLLRLLAG